MMCSRWLASVAASCDAGGGPNEAFVRASLPRRPTVLSHIGRLQIRPTTATHQKGRFNRRHPAKREWRWSSARWYIDGRTVWIPIQWVG